MDLRTGSKASAVAFNKLLFLSAHHHFCLLLWLEYFTGALSFYDNTTCFKYEAQP